MITDMRHLISIMEAAPKKTFKVGWGEKGDRARGRSLGQVRIEAENEREARRIFKSDYAATNALGFYDIEITHVTEL
jgi:hypothetical protein